MSPCVDRATALATVGAFYSMVQKNATVVRHRGISGRFCVSSGSELRSGSLAEQPRFKKIKAPPSTEFRPSTKDYARDSTLASMHKAKSLRVQVRTSAFICPAHRSCQTGLHDSHPFFVPVDCYRRLHHSRLRPAAGHCGPAKHSTNPS